ncbi:MAG: hypothetical protein KF900_07520 [Bacteroidetes bacterium]|nr:hypothetical protein [Bacteroidota bacterium]
MKSQYFYPPKALILLIVERATNNPNSTFKKIIFKIFLDNSFFQFTFANEIFKNQNEKQFHIFFKTKSGRAFSPL